jgi:capsular polysaccharide biosynthesis protein
VSQIDLTPSGTVSTVPNGSVGHFEEPVEGRTAPPDWQRRVARALRRTPGLALALSLIVAALLAFVGASSVVKAPTTFHSSAVMLIDDPRALATAGDDGEMLKLNELRTKYSALVGTNLIAQPVATQLHLPVGEVLADVTAVVPFQSLLLDITATGATPHFAERLAHATADELTTYVTDEGSLFNIPTEERYTITVIEPAKSATSNRPSHAYALTLGAGLAVVGFIVTFVLVQVLRRRRDIFHPA